MGTNDDVWKVAYPDYLAATWTPTARGTLSRCSRWMGRDLTYTHVTYTKGISPFTNFTLHRGMEIQATRPDGGAELMDFAYTFVERNGQFKVYIYKD